MTNKISTIKGGVFDVVTPLTHHYGDLNKQLLSSVSPSPSAVSCMVENEDAAGPWLSPRVAASGQKSLRSAVTGECTSGLRDEHMTESLFYELRASEQCSE